MPPGPDRRWWWRAAVLVSALVLVAGAATAAVNYLRIDSPSQVVRSYFSALQSADASRALGYGRPVSGDTRYLTSAVLSAQQHQAAISAPAVLNVQQSGTTSMVTVSYSIGSDRPLTEKIVLHRSDRTWRLDTPAPVVRLDFGPARHRANLAGLALPAEPVALFPGAVPVRYDTDRIQAQSDSDRITFTATGVLRVTPELTDAGRTAVDSAVQAAMNVCLKTVGASVSTCPLTPVDQRAVPSSLRGAVSGFTADDGPALVSTDPDGLVEVSGSFKVNGSWLTLDYNNQAQRHSGTAAVTMTARTYLTTPTTVAWTPG